MGGVDEEVDQEVGGAGGGAIISDLLYLCINPVTVQISLAAIVWQ